MGIMGMAATSSSALLPSKPVPGVSNKKRRSVCSVPTSARHLPSLRRRGSTQPVQAFVKEDLRFGKKPSWCDLGNLDSPLALGRLIEEKFRCWFTKEETSANTEQGSATKGESNEVVGKSWIASHPRLFKIIVGTSVVVGLGLCSYFVIPKVIASRRIVVPYSDLVSHLREGSVVGVQFAENSRHIFFNTLQASAPNFRFFTRNIDDDKYEILQLLREQGITYGSNPELLPTKLKSIMFILLQQLPYWVMVVLTCYQLSVQLSIGKNTSRKPSKIDKVTFNDVEGVDAAKAELLEIVLCMNGDSKYKKLGANVPRGVLLTGPPGTGKTLLARAVAGEAGLAFFSISASELVEVFVGRGAARVRDLFNQARKHAPAIIFIDEIDAIGGHRGSTLNCERDQTLNQLLTEMDGFQKDKNVVVIAATNRPEALDSALLRAGRFCRKVVVEQPNEEGRRKIFGLYLRDVPMEEDKEPICELVASSTAGLVGADLKNIADEAVLLAARRGAEAVAREDIIQAIERSTSKPFSSYTYEPRRPFVHGNMGGEGMGDGGALGFATGPMF